MSVLNQLFTVNQTALTVGTPVTVGGRQHRPLRDYLTVTCGTLETSR